MLLHISFALLATAGGAHAQTVDASTLTGKLVYGYQGWFRRPGETPSNNIHWSTDGNTPNANTKCLFDTDLKFPNGTTAQLYTSTCDGVVDTHFRWMRENGLDGVFVQRFFPYPVNNPDFTVLLQTIRAKAEKYGRVFAVEYDLNGGENVGPRLTSQLRDDWVNLTALGIIDSPAYIHHNGKPVVEFWGPSVVSGVSGAQVEDLIGTFQQQLGAYGERTFSRPRRPFEFTPSFMMTDALMPWPVGGYNFQSYPDHHQNVVLPDIALTHQWGVDYAPVIFPGSSDAKDGTPNDTPRFQGQFYTEQANLLIADKSLFLFSAMWDEFDEGTNAVAFLPKAALPSARYQFVGIDQEGPVGDNTNFYLTLGTNVTRQLRAAWGLPSP
ncbi:hypothetical protein AURDEDRAFT_175010 [Auricularia subglabra TFB-10046 SS5]|nr:hypothetical protein AURDEDRAFT_175010 [Auricularia subglabra TFB-10046 SS5]